MSVARGFLQNPEVQNEGWDLLPAFVSWHVDHKQPLPPQLMLVPFARTLGFTVDAKLPINKARASTVNKRFFMGVSS
jgi:hypothetical protein